MQLNCLILKYCKYIDNLLIGNLVSLGFALPELLVPSVGTVPYVSNASYVACFCVCTRIESLSITFTEKKKRKETEERFYSRSSYKLYTYPL